MKITYSKATTADIEPIYQLCKQLIDDYEDIDSIDYDKVLLWVRRKLERSIGEYTTVYADENLTGYYHFFINEDGEPELDDLYILPEYQCRGIGSEIIKKCVSLADEPIMFYVFKRNQRAISLYRRLGFEVTETVSDTRYIMRNAKEEKS